MKSKCPSRIHYIYSTELQKLYSSIYFIKNTENKLHVKEKPYIYSGKNCFFFSIEINHRTQYV